MRKATLKVHIDDTEAVVAGSCVSGAVYINAYEEIHGCGLALVFQGIEFTRVAAGEVVNEANRIIMTCPVPMHQAWSELLESFDTTYNNSSTSSNRLSMQPLVPTTELRTIPPGRHEVPFTLELPEWLPGSMKRSERCAMCEIYYEFIAILQGSGRLWNYHDKRRVLVRARSYSPLPIIPYTAPLLDTSIRTCGCLGRKHGTIHGTASISLTNVEKGGTFSVSVACRNQSRIKIDAIEVTLRECILIEIKKLSYCMNHELDCQTFDASTTRSWNGIASNNTSPLDHEHLTPYDMQAMMDELQDPSHALQLKVPQDALCTHVGQHMVVQHVVRVVWKTSACCTTNPTLDMPILQVTEPSSGMNNINNSGNTTTAATTATNLKVTPLVHVSSSSVMLGDTGDAISSSNILEAANVGSVEQLAHIMDMNVSESLPSLSRLIQDINDSTMAARLVEQRTHDTTWQPIFQSLTPIEYAQIIQCIHAQWDQVTIATIIARLITSFSCDHVMAVLGSIAEGNHTRIVEALLPCVHDYAQHGARIEEALSEWDRMLLRSVFT
jgi:hypothetical protein